MSAPVDNSIAVSMGSSYLGFFAHAGFLAGLEARGIHAGHFAGASAGGLTAGLAASGRNAGQIAELVMRREFTSRFFEWLALLRLPLALLNRPGHAGPLSGDKLRRYLDGKLGAMRIEDCPRRLHLAVTNLCGRRPELATRGSLSEFMVASLALPGVFRPRAIGDAAYWDGGIANELPIEHWIDDPRVRTIIAHAIRPNRRSPAPGRYRASTAIDAAHRTVCSALDGERRRRLRGAGKELILIETRSPRPRLLDPGGRSRRHCHRLGYESALAAARLDELAVAPTAGNGDG